MQAGDASSIDWPTVDRWLMGEAWIGTQIPEHLTVLCEEIGPRWSSTPAERETVDYICAQMRAAGLDQAGLEEFELDSWRPIHASAALVEQDREVPILPFHRCPTCDIQAPIANVGYGTSHEIDALGDGLAGAVAGVALGHEPFTKPELLPYRLRALADAGAVAAIVVDRKEGGRMEYHNLGDWRDLQPDRHPIPTVTVSREDGARLRRAGSNGEAIRVRVESEFYRAPAYNTAAVLAGSAWPDEHLLLGGHHDTVFGAPGGNDNASGTIVVMETARVLTGLMHELGVRPARSIRFVTFAAEEQNLQGSAAYVAAHYGSEPPPRLAINLDELSAGTMKGLVLGFPHLRSLVQEQFAQMGDGLHCHVMAQVDTSSDHFPFLRQGIDAAHLWRWRFHGRRPDSDFHHEPGDTVDKVDVRQLKEYVGYLARLLLRLASIAPEDWPANTQDARSVRERIERERGELIRVY